MRYSRLAFMQRFTDVELATIYTVAKQDVRVEVWLAKFNAATPDADGTCIDSENEETAGGIQALEMFGLIGPGRAAEILAAPVAGHGKARVLPPFNVAHPGEYDVVSIAADGTATLDGAGDFAAEFWKAL